MSAFFERCVVQAEQLAMDGKTMRGTLEAGDTRGVHLRAVYAVGAGVVLKQVDASSKGNEISAAPKVLTDIDLKDKVLTGDAMFTPHDWSAQSVVAGGHYLWTVKDNQPTLRADIERLFGPEHVRGVSATADRFSICHDHHQRPGSLGNAYANHPCFAQYHQ